MPSVDAYNRRNNPDYPNVYYIGNDGGLRLGFIEEHEIQGGSDTIFTYNEYIVRDSVTKVDVENTIIQYDGERPLPASSYDPNNLLALPSEITSVLFSKKPATN
ncbi:hypothetical protein [Pseudomonas avellanae]|nr:hypothetical protein [Pseudomonas avellanae]